MKLFGEQPPVGGNAFPEYKPLDRMELTLAISEWNKNGKVGLRPGSKAFEEARLKTYQDNLKAIEEQNETAYQAKKKLEEKKNEIYRPNQTNIENTLNIVGQIELTEEHRKMYQPSILDMQENREIISKDLEAVYSHQPDPKNFIGAMAGTPFEKEYTEEQIGLDIQDTLEAKEQIERENAEYNPGYSEAYNKKLQEYKKINNEKSSLFEALVVNQINNGWLPEMESILASKHDDYFMGIDSASRYKKDKYFGTSFDFTVSETEETITGKIQKYWDRFILKGSIPVMKYFEDPQNPEDRGRRVMPKFIIGGSHEDLEVIAKAYLADDLESIKNYPLRFTIVAQIDTQLEKILAFYSDQKNQDNPKFNFARKEFLHFKETLTEIKEVIGYDQACTQPEVIENMAKNKVLAISRSYNPTWFKSAKLAA